MSDKQVASLRSNFSINGEVSSKDTRFLSVTIDIMHTGLNLNNSFFDKEVVNSCIDSIKNTPILGFIKYDKMTQENDFNGHEYMLKRTENGVEEVYMGRCFGVIPESCNPRWTTKTCSDGQDREFLQVDGLMWEKFTDATDIVKRDVEKSQSMELSVSSIDGYEDDNGVFHFEKFMFDGACILGDDVEPAMIDANVKISEVQFAMSDFVKSIQGELNDKFIIFTKLINDETDQGGVENMPNADFTQTIMGQLEDIDVMVSQYETMENRWGDTVPRFYMADVQEDEVIAVDRKDSYRYYGFKFTMNEDKPEIDFANGCRKKIRYENYEDGSEIVDSGFDFGKHISDIEELAFSKVSEADAKVVEVENAKTEVETEYSQVKAEYDEIKPKYDEYVHAEEEREIAEMNAQKDAKFAEYEDVLSENAEFVALKENKDEMSVDEIEKECAVMYVKAIRSSKSNFSKANSNSAAIDVLNDDDAEADGYISTKYGNIRRSNR